MAKKIYISTNGTLNRVKKIYVGVNDISRKVKRGYIGVDSVARLFYVSEYVWKRYNVIYTYYWDKYNSVTQHKWNKFNVAYKSEYIEEYSNGSEYYIDNTGRYAKSYTFDKNTGLFMPIDIVNVDGLHGWNGYATHNADKTGISGNFVAGCVNEPVEGLYDISYSPGWGAHIRYISSTLTTIQTKGEFIEIISYINSRPYPDDGVYGDYWYTYIGSEQIKGDTNYGQVNSNLISEYPDNGLFGDHWYVKNPRIDTAIGSYIDNVISDEPDTYPENGIKDGYWYVKQQI